MSDPLERAFLAGKANGTIPDTVGWSTWKLVAETQHRAITDVLAAFYRARMSASSLQPVLDLAVELNPELRGR